MWWTINVVLAIVGAFLYIYGYWEAHQHSEAFGALIYMLIGLSVAVVAMVSSIVKLLFF